MTRTVHISDALRAAEFAGVIRTFTADLAGLWVIVTADGCQHLYGDHEAEAFVSGIRAGALVSR